MDLIVEHAVQRVQRLADKGGLTGIELSDRTFDTLETLPREKHRAFHESLITVTVWHGTRRREPIEQLKREGFCTYTEEQAARWLQEVHRRLCERTKVGPRVCKSLDRTRAMILANTSQSYRRYFSVTAIEDSACGEGFNPFTGKPDSDNLMSGWGHRNPEFVYDYLQWRANPLTTDQVLTEMFGRPLKVTLRLRLPIELLYSPQDMHTKIRCFKPEEIISIVPCPPKTTRQLKAEIDRLWVPAVITRR